MRRFFPFLTRRSKEIESDVSATEQPFVFKTEFQIQPISRVKIRINEFCSFLSSSVKFGNREDTAIGVGLYEREEQVVHVDSIYPVPDAKASGASVTITSESHRRLNQTLDYWNEKDEVAIFHSHPHFSSFKSATDDQHAIRMACLLFGGIVVMVIVDPFSSGGIDISGYAIEPVTKQVKKISVELVP